MTENTIPQVGDVVRWDPAGEKYLDMSQSFGNGPFLIIKMIRADAFLVTSLDGSRLKCASGQYGENTNYFSMKHMCFDVFLTAARRACATR